MCPTFTEDDIGKLVETAEGERLGAVADIDPETAYVEPAADAADSTRAALDWERDATEAVPLTDDAVTEITDDAIRLEAGFQAESIATGTEAEDDSSDEPGDSTEGIDRTDADYDPGEPVTSNSTDIAGTDDGPGTGTDGLDDSEPMMEDDEFYDTPEGGARVDPDDEMEPPEGTESSDATESPDANSRDDEPTDDDRDSTDRDDVDVDPDDVTEGDPEAEIDPEEDVGRRQGPE
ncbi:hypothetical protein HYG81_09935 [Natrinema zhouii]|uniref:Uncharacterized protein n=1 Tax=Natrinema zhouii TaxID=1710539 RepID=A0A7D6GSR6_9EURY|nr:hypothetical protein [Natrinema zhouii]QLK24444.1 hypothetical protein HYG81_09935 [Natrinema zhouii]